MTKAFITGLAGGALSADERHFLGAEKPAGVILFARNVASHDQIRRLVDDCKDATQNDDLLVLIDQEGGRVQRLRPPLGRALPPAGAYACLYFEDPARARAAAYAQARLVAADLRALGINTDCAPVLDVPVEGAHGIIGDRAYGTTPEQVADLGRAVAQGFMDGGVIPVIKHIPGHGRATKDSHFDLPVVTTTRDILDQTDFKAFSALADMPTAMTAHVVFTAIDAAHPASTSPIVTAEIIRGAIGFDGLLMSDDLSMKALSGCLASRARAVIRAGSDLALHCNGVMAEMVEVAAEIPEVQGQARRRLDAAIRILKANQSFDVAKAEQMLADVLAFAAPSAESV